ncbi:hypothetical protein [Erythrobacter sp. R86502]|uniref:hypothetical protein n=1 Tax=Erythrobacter sp. R86502 TaxID=3093846 RepID=UPI0036D3484F
MIASRELEPVNTQPADPRRRLPDGPTDWCDPTGLAFAARWQAHVDAGRIGRGGDACADARAIVLANEWLMFGRQRTILD